MASALLDALGDAAGYVGGVLDKPGRAVRGLLGGRPEEALAILPFSDAAGWTDPANAVSGRDLLNRTPFATGNDLIDSGLGLGMEMMFDPTTYLGGFAGRLGGKALGRGLEAAAKARGPGYATTLDDAIGMARRGVADPGDRREAVGLLNRLAHGGGDRAFGELPPGSSFLSAGQEGAAFRTPAGDVLRVGTVGPMAPGRPVADSVLQATRGVDYPVNNLGDAVRAERVPFVEHAGDLPFWLRGSGEPGLTRLGAVKRRAAGEGLHFHDAHAGNVGMLGDRPVILDPGAVSPGAAARTPGPASPLAATDPMASLGLSPAGTRPPGLAYQDVTAAAEPSALTRSLLDLLGGRAAMRRALDAGRAAPGYERGLGLAGAGAGAGLGAS